MFRSESFPSYDEAADCAYIAIAGPRTLAADRSMYALWPLAAGCHTISIDYYYYYYYASIYLKKV